MSLLGELSSGSFLDAISLSLLDMTIPDEPPCDKHMILLNNFKNNIQFFRYFYLGELIFLTSILLLVLLMSCDTNKLRAIRYILGMCPGRKLFTSLSSCHIITNALFSEQCEVELTPQQKVICAKVSEVEKHPGYSNLIINYVEGRGVIGFLKNILFTVLVCLAFFDFALGWDLTILEVVIFCCFTIETSLHIFTAKLRPGFAGYKRPILIYMSKSDFLIELIALIPTTLRFLIGKEYVCELLWIWAFRWNWTYSSVKYVFNVIKLSPGFFCRSRPAVKTFFIFLGITLLALTAILYSSIINSVDDIMSSGYDTEYMHFVLTQRTPISTLFISLLHITQVMAGADVLYSANSKIILVIFSFIFVPLFRAATIYTGSSIASGSSNESEDDESIDHPNNPEMDSNVKIKPLSNIINDNCDIVLCSSYFDWIFAAGYSKPEKPLTSVELLNRQRILLMIGDKFNRMIYLFANTIPLILLISHSLLRMMVWSLESSKEPEKQIKNHLYKILLGSKVIVCIQLAIALIFLFFFIFRVLSFTNRSNNKTRALLNYLLIPLTPIISLIQLLPVLLFSPIPDVPYPNSAEYLTFSENDQTWDELFTSKRVSSDTRICTADETKANPQVGLKKTPDILLNYNSNEEDLYNNFLVIETQHNTMDPPLTSVIYSNIIITPNGDFTTKINYDEELDYCPPPDDFNLFSLDQKSDVPIKSITQESKNKNSSYSCSVSGDKVLFGDWYITAQWREFLELLCSLPVLISFCYVGYNGKTYPSLILYEAILSFTICKFDIISSWIYLLYIKLCKLKGFILTTACLGTTLWVAFSVFIYLCETVSYFYQFRPSTNTHPIITFSDALWFTFVIFAGDVLLIDVTAGSRFLLVLMSLFYGSIFGSCVATVQEEIAELLPNDDNEKDLNRIGESMKRSYITENVTQFHTSRDRSLAINWIPIISILIFITCMGYEEVYKSDTTIQLIATTTFSINILWIFYEIFTHKCGTMYLFCTTIGLVLYIILSVYGLLPILNNSFSFCKSALFIQVMRLLILNRDFGLIGFVKKAFLFRHYYIPHMLLLAAACVIPASFLHASECKNTIDNINFQHITFFHSMLSVVILFSGGIGTLGFTLPGKIIILVIGFCFLGLHSLPSAYWMSLLWNKISRRIVLGKIVQIESTRMAILQLLDKYVNLPKDYLNGVFDSTLIAQCKPTKFQFKSQNEPNNSFFQYELLSETESNKNNGVYSVDFTKTGNTSVGIDNIDSYSKENIELLNSSFLETKNFYDEELIDMVDVEHNCNSSSSGSIDICNYVSSPRDKALFEKLYSTKLQPKPFQSYQEPKKSKQIENSKIPNKLDFNDISRNLRHAAGYAHRLCKKYPDDLQVKLKLNPKINFNFILFSEKLRTEIYFDLLRKDARDILISDVIEYMISQNEIKQTIFQATGILRLFFDSTISLIMALISVIPMFIPPDMSLGLISLIFPDQTYATKINLWYYKLFFITELFFILKFIIAALLVLFGNLGYLSSYPSFKELILILILSSPTILVFIFT